MTGPGPSLHLRQEAFARVCFAKAVPPEDLSTLGGAGDRWLLYRNMVRGRISKMIQSGLRRSVPLMGADAYRSALDAWFASHPPTTRYIREVVPAFSRFVLGRRETAQLPPQLPDTLRFETYRWEAGYDPVAVEIPVSDFDFAAVAVCNPTLRLIACRYPVHELPAREGATEIPETLREETPTWYAIYRKRDDQVTSRKLTERAHDWLAGLVEGQLPVTEAIQAVAKQRGEEIDAGYVEALGSTLATLLENDALLGSQA